MDSARKSEKSCGTLLRAAAGAVVFVVWLGVFMALAGQNYPDQPSAPAQQNEGESSQGGELQDRFPPPHQQLPRTLTLPGGTLITVRVSDFLSSDRNQPGDSFSAELAQPLVADGWVVSRRGQTVVGRVAVAQKAGRVKGVSQLGVELSQLILVDGQQLPIRTQLLQSSAGTSRGRDAAAVGTTTGVGAAIGAAAHGGEGAGIGAAVGAAAGVAGVLLTRGRPTVLPPETQLTFRLESPLIISTDRSQVAFRPVIPEDYEGRALGRRTQHFASAPYPPPPYYWGGYFPWGYYYYPAPLFFGFYSFGPRFGRRGFRR